MSDDYKDTGIDDMNQVQDQAAETPADHDLTDAAYDNSAGQDTGSGERKAETRIAKGNFRDTIRAVAGGYVVYLGIRILRDLEPIDRTPSRMLMPILFIIVGGIICYISLKSYFRTAKAISNGTYDNVDAHGNPIVRDPVPVKKEQAPPVKSSSSIADRAKAAAVYAVTDDDEEDGIVSDDGIDSEEQQK